jgi:hypothetical protein
VPGFYYIDKQHPNATNTNNIFGYPDKPRTSIPGLWGVPFPAGSVVEIHGHYDYPQTIFNAGKGTREAPIFIRGMDAATKPLISGAFYVVGCSYVVFENLKFADADGDLSKGSTGSFGISDTNRVKADSDHIVLRHCEVSGNMGAGSGTSIHGYAYETIISHVVFYDNFIHDCGNVNATNDQDAHAIAVGGNTDHVWILDNEMARCSGDGLQINGFGMGDPGRLNHIYAGRNHSHHNKQTGLGTKTAADVVFSQNVVHGHRYSNSSPGAGITTLYAPERVWIIYNHSYDNEIGIHNGSDSTTFGKDLYIIGNVINNIHRGSASPAGGDGWGQAGIMMSGGVNRYIINNTIYDVDAGINTPSPNAIYMSNNIISNVTKPDGKHINIAIPGKWEVKNCLFYQNGGPARIKIGSGVYSLPQLTSAFSKVQGCLTADPLFVNAATDDYRIQSTSPAVDSALEAGVYATFKDLYGLDISLGFDGTVRPQGPACDMGAYELVTPAKVRPASPGTPKVDVLRPNPPK